MRGTLFYGKDVASSTTTLRSFRNFNVRMPKRVESDKPDEPDQVPVSMNPATDAMEAEPAAAAADDEGDQEEEQAPLPGDKLRMEYEMEGKGWTPVNPAQTAPEETKEMGNSLDMQINRDVIQKIANVLDVKIPFRLVQDILKRNAVADMPTLTNLKKTAHDLMAIFDRETRTTVAPKYRTRLVQMLARAMHAYIAGKRSHLTGSGNRLRKKTDPTAYHPQAQAFIRGMKLAIKPALSIGATALHFSPSVTGQIISPFMQAAADTM